VVIQQNETDAVIGSGLSPTDRVVTTGFANLAEGSKVIVGQDNQAPAADLAPRKRKSSRDVQKDGQGKGGKGERRGKKGEPGQNGGDQKDPAAPAAAPAGAPPGGSAKSQQ
jgi:multidrug efflux system membrane fusion protein